MKNSKDTNSSQRKLREVKKPPVSGRFSDKEYDKAVEIAISASDKKR